MQLVYKKPEDDDTTVRVETTDGEGRLIVSILTPGEARICAEMLIEVADVIEARTA